MLRVNEPQVDAILEQAADTGRFLVDEEWLFSRLSSEHSPPLIAKAAWHGFLPMFSKAENLLLLKMHTERTLVAPGSIHVGRQSRKRAAQFRTSVNEAFDEVVKMIEKHTYTSTPGDSWLTPQLSELYKTVNQLPERVRRGVRFYSFELWHKDSGKLAAGEIGYTVGAIYSSCTGFALKEEFPGSGTLQLCALGKLLQQSGFQLWDLGMEMDYKRSLGGTLYPRASWIASERKFRQTEVDLNLRSQDASATTRELLVWSPGAPVTSLNCDIISDEVAPLGSIDTIIPSYGASDSGERQKKKVHTTEEERSTCKQISTIGRICARLSR